MTLETPQCMVLCNDHPYPGVEGKYSECFRCLDKIFISDSTLQSLERNKIDKAEYLCFSCAMPLTNPEFFPLTLEQKHEVTAALEYLRTKK